MIYNVNERPPFGKLIVFSLQMMLSVFVASTLIASICGVNVSAALVGAGFSTIIYGLVTGRKSPMFISNSGNYVGPVMLALAAAGYTGVAIGGLVSCIVYCIFGLIFTRISVDKIYNIFPASLIGSITAVIGLTLMSFIPTYIQINGEASQWGIIIALITMFSVAIISHYAKGIGKLLPFLFGTLIGYGVSVILTLTNICPLIDFSVFKNIGIFCMPEFAFTKFTKVEFASLISIIIVYIAYTISAMMECLSDHAALGGIIGKDLYQEPGLGRIFIGEGVANLVGATVGGLGQCSYGEGVACVGFSKVASRIVVDGAAVILALMGFIAPIQAFIASIPSCVFGGCAIILYSFISISGIKMLKKVDLDNTKNILICGIVLSAGVSQISVGAGNFSMSGTALALILGVIVNIVLK